MSEYDQGFAGGRESCEDEIEELRADNKRLRTALQAFAKHFGPLEDNHMIHPEARRCFRLARAALGHDAIRGNND